MKKNGILKISRGYRLKISTHKLIKSLQDITQEDSDTVLKRACMLYYKTILDQNIERAQSVPMGKPRPPKADSSGKNL
jgi:hypothetical protein